MNDDFRDAAADDPTGAGPTEAARTEAMDADAAPPAADWPRIGPYDVIRHWAQGEWAPCISPASGIPSTGWWPSR
jgi:hypothetical protein